MKKICYYIFLCLILLGIAPTASAYDVDSEGYPELYIRGTMTNSWSFQDSYKMSRNGSHYTISISSLNGEFKIGSTDWVANLGNKGDIRNISSAETFLVTNDGGNLNAINLSNVRIDVDVTINDKGTLADTYIQISANGVEAPAVPGGSDTPITSGQPSGTLPVLYINVYDANGNLDNEVISANLDHKNYFSGEYWLDVNGCQWLIDEGAANVGSKAEPLPLEIKARGNYTRKAFAKKPFKLKLGAKQSLLGMSKSKHYAILAHADDNYGYLRNFTGFNLGRRIGLPWTPWQQPVEVVINGDYRGLYFLTESIRIEKDRVNITELDDNVETPELISGGYIVELDNYDEDNQIRMDEKSCVSGHIIDKLRITWDTPEEYSAIQKQFITDQFSAMNNAIGNNSDDLWKYMDLDDAARYYIVKEIISDVEAYHGSTYLFRDHGEGMKWHFSPLWDCGNGFNGSSNQFFYDNDPYGNTWIPSMRNNQTFNNKVFETWKWFMQKKFPGLYEDIDNYVNHISEAAKYDRARWKDAPRPTNEASTQDIVDNSNMQSRRDATVNHLQAKIAWLAQQWGSYSNGNFTEPERDTTEAAPLPSYTEHVDPVTIYFIDDSDSPWTSNIHAYIWDNKDGSITEHLGKWPGQAMTQSTIFGQDCWTLTFTPYGLSENAKLIFNNGNYGTDNQTEDKDVINYTIYYRSGTVTGIENIESDSMLQNTEYFDLQGISINAPIKGQLYIVRRGTTVTKEIYK